LFIKIFPTIPKVDPNSSYLNWLINLQMWPMIFLSKTYFFVIYISVQWQKSFKIQYLPYPKIKSYKIYFIKSCSSRSFQQHQRQIPIHLKFWVMILFYVQWQRSFKIQELLHHKSNCYETKPMHPFSSRAFQRYQEHDLKHCSLVDLIITKQNKLPCFIDRYNRWTKLHMCNFINN
jgi:hypothetical protein